MPTEYVIPTPQQAAYHEAGHCYYAVKEDRRIAELMRIYPAKGGWEGVTDLIPDNQVRGGWTTIALAGVVAEAKFQAIVKNPEQNTLISTRDVFDEIEKYVGSIWPFDPKAQPILTGLPAIQVNVWIHNEGQVAEASISRNDVLRMTPHYRDRNQIEVSFGTLVQLFNQEDVWDVIHKLATAVLESANKSILRPTIDAIVRP